MISRSRPDPLVLCILDGWGERPNADDNAIAVARAPVWHRLLARWPHAHLQASEHYVGLPDGQMGNSEVGHTNLGAGRLVLQDLPRIDAAIANGQFATMSALRDFIGKLKGSRGIAHLMGLLSPGGVHSHQNQIAVLARILAEAGVPVAVHAFLDGRDAAQGRGVVSGKFRPGRCRPRASSRRHPLRPLLCDGSRQALGARRKSLSADRAGHR
jgi:2,3-bisphosphoglycerate-independent phosphoglycerate mutase